MKYGVFTLLAVAACHAGTIATLNSTGAGLPDQSLDPNWTVNGQQAFVTESSGLPFGPGAWSPNTDAKLIGPQPDYTQGATDSPGPYYYFTMFDLNGFDLATVSITVHAASDNFLVWLKLNDVLVHSFLPPVTDYTVTPEFTLVSGFTSGLNTLEFKTINSGPPHNTNPSGFRASFDSMGDVASGPPDGGDRDAGGEVPEPGSAALIGGGLLALGLWRKRRSQ